jgi:uncharacterized protein YbcC (UPF0753/DUF2309 family)
VSGACAAPAPQAPSERRLQALEAACRAVAPAWPLDRQIAVSPYWGQRDVPFAAAAASLHRRAGAAMALPRAAYLRAWEAAEIQQPHLEAAVREQPVVASVEAAVAALRQPRESARGLPLLSDQLEADPAHPEGSPWSTRITFQISEWCAAYFDRVEADWHPEQRSGLFSGWRAALLGDRRLASLRARVARIPADARSALDWALDGLAIRDADATELLHVLALRIGGWAAWCAYLRWEAALAGQEDAHLGELLVIRLCWEALLHDGRHDEHSRWSAWMRHWNAGLRIDSGASIAIDLLWQRAHEIAYQQHLLDRLRDARDPAGHAPPRKPSAQLVFCIDVRSERMRRAVEAADPDTSTHGFAGFFGLPIRYAPLGTALGRAQLPGLLAPTLDATDTTGEPTRDASLAGERRAVLGRRASLRRFGRLPSGAFTFVEMLGLAFLPKLLARTLGRPSPGAAAWGLRPAQRAELHPQLTGGAADPGPERAALAEGILRAMGLTDRFAGLLAVIGHGAQTVNNPQAAGLACGACGGNSGEINARLLAGLLNDPAVRADLAQRGIRIPERTVAIAGLHDTVTDTVELFDLERVPSSHAADVERLRETLRRAGAQARRERAASLGLARFSGHESALLRLLKRRGRDWAQIRPEWGLAGNAAFIVAGRERTRGIDLEGRVFLHDYRWQADRDGALLEQILAGPLIVTHWINLQYFGSTVAPERFGSGNKVLHNVVGGHIGVLEGQGGDLRIGLARQSVHDGARWMHAPLRLSVLIEAPRDRIERVIERQPGVGELVRNQWLYLYRLEGRRIERLAGGRWQPCEGARAPDPAAAGEAQRSRDAVRTFEENAP